MAQETTDTVVGNTEKIAYLGMPCIISQPVSIALSELLRERGFSVFDLDKATDKDLSNPANCFVLFIPEINYEGLSSELFRLNAERKACLDFISERAKAEGPLCILTLNNNAQLFGNIVVPLEDVIASTFSPDQYIPNSDENLQAIPKILSAISSHGMSCHGIDPFRKNFPKDESSKCGSYEKTVLFVDDVLCSNSYPMGRFFQTTLKVYGAAKGINFLFSSSPHEFFEQLKKHPVDVVMVDLDFSEWRRHPDSKARSNIEFFTAGYEKIGWRIIEKLFRECFEGWNCKVPKNEEGSDQWLFEVLPEIYIYTSFSLKSTDSGGIEYQHPDFGKIVVNGFKLKDDKAISCISQLNDGICRINIHLKQKSDFQLSDLDHLEIKREEYFPLDREDSNTRFSVELRNFVKRNMYKDEKSKKKDLFVHFSEELSEKDEKYWKTHLMDNTAGSKDFSIKLDWYSYCYKGSEAEKIQWYIMNSLDEYIRVLKKQSNHKIRITETLDVKDKVFTQMSPYEIFDENEEESGGDGIRFLGETYSNRIFLASTPLTGIQLRDSGIKPEEWYQKKLCFLLDKGFGAIVLKTSSYNTEDFFLDGGTDIRTAQKKISQTRVYWSKKTQEKHPIYLRDTFYNTGSTSEENLKFPDYCDFLKDFRNRVRKVHRIIPSVASKSYRENIWRIVFTKMKECSEMKGRTYYPVWEINSRYTIRGILSEDGISDASDEYLIYGQEVKGFYEKFENWISLINEFAVKNEIKLLIKFPFRSDILNLVASCQKASLSNNKYGIKGLTLINTVKAPYFFNKYSEECKNDPGFVHIDKDGFGLPQMSGASLKFLRDWTLFQVSRFLRFNPGLEISASGGIMNGVDISACLKAGAKTVQIGTAALRDFSSLQNKFENYASYNHVLSSGNVISTAVKGFSERYAVVDSNKCTRCEKCMNTFYCDALLNRSYGGKRSDILSELDKPEIIDLSPRDIILPPKKMPPVINPKLCLGCGLCVQVCSGAISLVYKGDT